MSPDNLCLKSIVRDSEQIIDIPDMDIDTLKEYLQPFFPRYDISHLLSYSGLISASDQIDPLLIYSDFIRIESRFAESGVLILTVIITGKGANAIRIILGGYVTRNDNDN